MSKNWGCAVATPRHRTNGTVEVMLYGGGGHASFELKTTDAEKLARDILETVAAADRSPREGTPADLGCEVL